MTETNSQIIVNFPAWSKPWLFESHRYKVAYGGRGSSKSWTFARAALVLAARRKMRVLCAREFQTSIRESVHEILKQQIDKMGLGAHYEVLQREIRCINGSEFIFMGLHHNIAQIKSTEDIDLCWVEEAETVSEESWATLEPTVIRKAGSELWITFNPSLESDPTYKRWVANPPPGCVSKSVNWMDNPWLTKELLEQKDHAYATDPEAADHVWGGKIRCKSKAQVLNGKWVVQDFDPAADWYGPYYGVDWGFGVDPTTMVRCWVTGEQGSLNRDLWIEHEAYGHGVDNDDLPALFDSVPGGRTHVIYADNARPETISHMVRHGYSKMQPCKKWPGSVEDGIAHLRGYSRIVIHPRCRHAVEEAKLWRYKTDKLTGEVMPILLDSNNHIWDAVRYALGPLMKKSNIWLLCSRS